MARCQLSPALLIIIEICTRGWKVDPLWSLTPLLKNLFESSKGFIFVIQNYRKIRTFTDTLFNIAEFTWKGII